MSTRRSSLRRSLRRGRRAVQPELSALSLPKLDRVFYIRSNGFQKGPLVDFDSRYAEVASGTVDLYHANIAGTETVSKSGTATVTVSAGKITIGAGTVWDIESSTGRKWVFCEPLSATSVIMWDVSGNDDHLLATGLSSDVVTALCSSGVTGSDHLKYGYKLADGSQYISSSSMGLLPDGVVIPMLGLGLECVAYEIA